MSKSSKETLQLEIDDLENVEENMDGDDVSISADLFTISSYGVDNTVDHLIKRLKNKNYYIPDFQRAYVWNQTEASKFIESLLLGLPVPGIFLYKESDTPRHLVIDGQQRLKSLVAYFDGLFKEKKFRLTGLKTKWDGLTLTELDEDDKIRLEDAVIHSTIFKQDSPSQNMDSVYEVFERINTGGVKLSPQEIRSCVAQGNFNELLFQLNDEPVWRKVFGPKSIRLKDVELILRFFAFQFNRGNYERPVKKFLTDYMTSHKNLSDDDFKTFALLWETTLKAVTNALEARPFRPSRALNVALFDSFMVAVANRINNRLEINSEALESAYTKLLTNEDFVKYISSGTSGDDSVKYRFAAAIEAVDQAHAG